MPSLDPSARPDVRALQALLASTFAPWIQELGLIVTGIGDDSVTLTLPMQPRFVHVAGVMCGQTLMSAADTAMVLALSHRLGGFRPMTTVQLQCSFLRPVPAGLAAVQVTARVLKCGRSLAFGEIALALPDGALAAHVTTTYALL